MLKYFFFAFKTNNQMKLRNHIYAYTVGQMLTKGNFQYDLSYEISRYAKESDLRSMGNWVGYTKKPNKIHHFSLGILIEQ